ncbi:MAG TPA: heavy metal transporter [Clostridiales bacterium]|nr:heavy metal-associated domain-containing protein [Clostridia bacterium]MDD4680456.1 heavy metal-associated domain-containing protein [Clostridia bacterium]HCS72888.1 heavy metal transporter [Clostridiales bacterium]
MTKRFRLQGLGCANCAAKIEAAINKLEGVKEASVNFMTAKIIIEGDKDKMPSILQEAERIVKKFEPDVVMKKA